MSEQDHALGAGPRGHAGGYYQQAVDEIRHPIKDLPQRNLVESKEWNADGTPKSRPQPSKIKHRAPIHLSDGEVTAIIGRMLQLAHRGKLAREEKEELKRLRKDINLIHKRLMEYHRLVDALLATGALINDMVPSSNDPADHPHFVQKPHSYDVSVESFEALKAYRES